MKRKGSKVVVAAVLLILLSGMAGAQEVEQEPEQAAQEERGSWELDRLGLLFSAPSILLELDEYQRSGIGVKAYWGDFAGRGLLGFVYDTGAEELHVTTGLAVEYHLSHNRVSPYVGGELVFDYGRTDAAGTTVREYGFGLGPLFGIEFVATEVLSLFAEYRIGFNAVYADSESDMGDDQAWNYTVATELGNQGALGIIVYFVDRRPVADNTDSSEETTSLQ